MLSYFMSADYTISDKLVQIMYILSGLFCMYCGVRAWMVKANKHYIPTGCFWFALGIVAGMNRDRLIDRIVKGACSSPSSASLLR